MDAEHSKAPALSAAPWFSSSEVPPDSGEIDCHHTLLVLLHRVYSGRLTGKLQVVFGRVEKALFFDNGQLVFATSSDRQDGLGEVMLRAGALTQSQFEEASTLVETGQRFGSAIAEMGVYGVEEILSWVRRQVIQVIASVLDYPAGRYFFFSSLEKNVVPEIGAPVPLANLLLDAVRKAGDLPFDQLADDADLRLELSSGSSRPFKTVDLDDHEQRVLALMFRRLSPKDIVTQSALPKPQASRALYALLLLGFVTAVPNNANSEPATRKPEPIASDPPAALEEPPLVQREKQKTAEAAAPANISQQHPVKVEALPELPKTAEAPPALSEAPAQSMEARALEPRTSETQTPGVKPDQAPTLVNVPELPKASLPAQAEEVKATEVASTDYATHAQPQLEEIPPPAPEQSKETQAAPVPPVPLLKPNMVAREVQLRLAGISTGNGQGRQLFNEETVSLLVAETAGIIRLSAAVTPGQLLVLTNVETKREVIVQVVRKRAYQPPICYLELEFAESAPRFWGTEFSAATALLPKNAQDAEMAAIVMAAPAAADQPWVLPPGPDAGELQTFRREMEDLRGEPLFSETLAGSGTQAGAFAHLSSEVSRASAVHGPGDSLSTEAILRSGLDAAGAAPPVERDAPPAPWETGEQEQTPQTVNDFLNSLPRSKRWRLPRGSFTPGFRAGIVRLGLLAAALIITIIGAAWFKNLLPWKRAEAKFGKNIAYNMRVASDTPTTSVDAAAKVAPVSNTVAPAQPVGMEPAAAVPSPSTPAEQPVSKKIASGKTTSGKPSVVRPVAKPVDSNANFVKESVFIPPKLIHAEQAVASLEAMHDFERGNVVVDAVVGTSGEVHVISVLSGPPSLRDSAVESLKLYKYEPATRNGQPVPAHVTITIHFRFEP